MRKTFLLVLLVAWGCGKVTFLKEGLPCEDGRCAKGWECRPDTNVCVPELARGCGGSGVCWSEVETGDACSVDGAYLPCGPFDDCRDGCRTCAGGLWGACGFTDCELGTLHHCGRCGDDCDDAILHASGIYCNVGGTPDRCDFVACAEPWENSDGDRSNGCECTPAGEEVCDGVDNDCSGVIDDLNAAAVQAECDALHPNVNVAVWTCAGACAVGTCASGWSDMDGEAATGCEINCVVSNGGVEICDGLDNDCNDTPDDVADIAAECLADYPGALHVQTWVCTAGTCDIQACEANYSDLINGLADGCESPCVPTGAEVCDGDDDDCSGTADDMTPAAIASQCNTTYPDPPAELVQTWGCVAGACAISACQTNHHDIDTDPTNGCEYDCTPTVPTTEICDTFDNDCNGLTDQGCPCNFNNDPDGICAAGTIAGSICQQPASYQATETTCDSLDNDCDAYVDEGCTCNYNNDPDGVCAGSTRDSVGVCQTPAAYEAAETSCDSLNNDCDIGTDEGCPCNYNNDPDGVCATATRNTSGVCSAPTGYQGTETLCDSLNNDCDIGTDEGCQCNYIDESDGVCGTATRNTSGVCTAPGNYQASESLCDILDNDCDTYVDEGCACDYSGDPDGVCGTAVRSATGVCQQPATWQAVESLCDTYDNDCDGSTDEGCVCTGLHTFTVDNELATPACATGTTNVVLMRLRLTSAGCNNTLLSLTFTRHARSDTIDADFPAGSLRLYEDVDNNGVYDSPTDTLVGTAPAMSGGLISFTSLTFSMAADTSRNLILVGTTSGTSYFAAQITDTNAFTLQQAAQTRALGDMPLVSGAHNLSGQICPSLSAGAGSQAAVSATRVASDDNPTWASGAGSEAGWTAGGAQTTAVSDCNLETPDDEELRIQDAGTTSAFVHVDTGVPLGLPLCSLSMRIYASKRYTQGGARCNNQLFTDNASMWVYAYSDTDAVNAGSLQQTPASSATVGPAIATCTSDGEPMPHAQYLDINILPLYTAAAAASTGTLNLRFIPEDNGNIATAGTAVINAIPEIYVRTP